MWLCQLLFTILTYPDSALHIQEHTLSSCLTYTATIFIEPYREKTDFCLCEKKGADQLRGNCEADQRLCFGNTDNTIPLLLKSEILSF